MYISQEVSISVYITLMDISIIMNDSNHFRMSRIFDTIVSTMALGTDITVEHALGHAAEIWHLLLGSSVVCEHMA